MFDMPLKVKRVDSEKEVEATQLLRAQVFVNEQGVPSEVEIDGFDVSAIHAVAYHSGVVVGTGRLVIDTPVYGRIGRIAVEASHRRRGIGSALLVFLENEARALGINQVRLHAQNHVKDFYSKYGYQAREGTFLEAGILHVEMEKYIA